MASPDGSGGAAEGAGAATEAGKETGHRQRTDHSKSSKMKDAVHQWDKIREEYANNNLDMSKWGEICHRGMPSRAKFAKLRNINPDTFARYAHNNKSRRTLIGSKLGRPTLEAAAARQAANDRARMIRQREEAEEWQKQQQWLDKLLNTPGPEQYFYDDCQQTAPFIYRAFYDPPPYGREEFREEREARHHTMVRQILRSRAFQLSLYLKKKGIIDCVYRGKVGKFRPYRHMMDPENPKYAPPSHLWGRIPNASYYCKTDYIKWCRGFKREMKKNEELRDNYGHIPVWKKRNIPEDAKP